MRSVEPATMRRPLPRKCSRLLLIAAAVCLLLPAGASARNVYVTAAAGPPYQVWVIDTASNAVSGTPIDVGTLPEGVAVTPDGSRAYVANWGSGSVSVIDTATRIASTVAGYTQVNPAGVAVSPDGSRAYVSNKGSNTVSVINTATNSVLVDVPVPVGSCPIGLAVTPDGRRVYVANGAMPGCSDSISVIDTVTTSVTTITADIGTDPVGVSMTPDGSTAYITNSGSNNVSVVSTATNTVTGTIPLAGGSTPYIAALTPDGGRLYVPNYGSTNVSVIDTGTQGVSLIGDSGIIKPVAAAVTPDGSTVYVTNELSDNVSVFGTATNAPVAGPITMVGTTPQFVAIAPDQAPTASFTASPGTVAEGSAGQGVSAAGKAREGSTATTFNASSSSDPDGSVARYDWDFGDGAKLDNGGATPAHTYANLGAYTVTLTVTDNEGTSTEKVFTGQTMLRNGSSSARKSEAVTIGDTAGPTVKVKTPKKNKRTKRKKFKRISGTASDVSGVSRVEYALALKTSGKASKAAKKRAKKACRFFTRKSTLKRKATSCKRPKYLTAKGTTSWSAKIKKLLPRGSYAVWVKATDTAGNTSKAVEVSFRLV